MTFDQSMFSLDHRAKTEAGYSATLFLRMITERGGLATARMLIDSDRPSKAHTALYERGRPDLTVEAMILESPRFHDLFTLEELKRAARRLGQYGYRPGSGTKA